MGTILFDAEIGPLGCWDNFHAFPPDGRDVESGSIGNYRITEISPAPGALAGAADVITLHVVPFDPTAPPVLQPCDWITSAEATNALGGQTPSILPGDDEEGSLSPFCTYNADGKMITSQLDLSGSFPVDARSDFDMAGLGADNQTAEAHGMPGSAKCVSTQRESGMLRRVSVLLAGNRIYAVDGPLPCETLEGLASTAIARIGS
ncbi:hypothetical protein OG976_14825 [Mycobacterium sp. NBC_00419]|uniref:hypothetical protein n=1 Tax=Mycobacterium sp. NBC_00419 TaxID=2975989 RepID=UPI002E21055B